MIVLATMLCAAGAYAGNAPAAAPTGTPASEDACRAACGKLIDRCTGIFGPAMGDMRPFCTKAVMDRCKTTGLAACDVVARDAGQPAR
jgi:hypothetical protein